MPPKTYPALGPLAFIVIFFVACTGNSSAVDKNFSPATENAKQNTQISNEELNNGRLSIGFNYAEKKDPKALGIADSLIRLGKTNEIVATGFYLKGIYFTNVSNVDKAITYFDSAIVTNYTFTDPYIEKAILLYEWKKYDLAIDLLGKASQLDRYNPEIYYWIAKNYEAEKNHEEAFFYYEQTLVLDPKFNNAQESIDNLKSQSKRTDKK